MPRALAVRHVTVDAPARAGYLARLSERAASARAAAFRLDAFEDDARPGRFVELVETRDGAALATALLHDDLLAESLDFRHEAGAPAGPWHRYSGVADR